MSTEKPYKPAALTPCPECPWRAENSNRPAPEPYEDSYTREHHLRCWSDLRNGRVSGCHLTGSREEFPHGGDPRWIAAGYQAVPENVDPRECAGSVAAAYREVRYLLEAGSFAKYQKRRPQGMTRTTAELWLARVQLGATGGVWPTLRPPVVEDEAIIDPAADYVATHLELLEQRQVAALTDMLNEILGPPGCPA